MNTDASEENPAGRVSRGPTSRPDEGGHVGEIATPILIGAPAQGHDVMPPLLDEHAQHAFDAVADEVAAHLVRLLPLPNHLLPASWTSRLEGHEHAVRACVHMRASSGTCPALIAFRSALHIHVECNLIGGMAIVDDDKMMPQHWHR